MEKSYLKKGELKLLWPFYSEAIISHIFLLLPFFFIPYMLSLNFSLGQIGLLCSALSIAVILFELPTGAVADLFGRKFSVILGNLLCGAVLLIPVFTKNFYFLLLFMFAFGISQTFISGANEAWVVDLLKSRNKGSWIQGFYSKRSSLGNGGMLLAGLIGASLVKIFGLFVLWPVTSFSFFTSAAILTFGKEHFIKRKKSNEIRFRDIYDKSKKSISYVFNHHILFLITLSSMMVALGLSFSDNVLWYPLLVKLGFREYWFGYLGSLTFLFGVFVPYLSGKILKRNKNYKSSLIFILAFQPILALMVLFAPGIYSSLALYLGLICVMFTYFPLRDSLAQKYYHSNKRATLTSVNSLAVSIIGAIFSPIAGYLADNFGLQNIIALSSIFFILAIILYYRIKER